MKPTSETGLFRATGLFAFAFAVLFVIRQDFWLSDSSALVAGLPSGLLFHLGYCVLVSVVLGFFLYGRRR